jgi:hypothetical protein
MLIDSFFDDLPELDPVIFHEQTAYGWRGLTTQGEVLEVKSPNGNAIEVPSEITMMHAGKAYGRRAVRNALAVDIDDYLQHFNRAVALYRDNRLDEALSEADEAVNTAPTLRAKFNRAMILLSAGRWCDGFEEYLRCEEFPPFMRSQVHAALGRGLKPWRGDDLRGKRLLLLHAHGFGDTIMMLRYLPKLVEMGAEIVMEMPPALQRLTKSWSHGSDGDYFCPILHLLHYLDVTPDSVDCSPYIAVDSDLLKQRHVLAHRTKVGIAWSVGKPHDGDFPREIALIELVGAFDRGEVELHSVQLQDADEARRLGVQVHEFDDFADCAALMMQMDMIVSVDTAALHLAGAIGHPHVCGLLSHWASWRWLSPWYANVKFCRQTSADDWSSALAQLKV